ncbi:MAG: SIMPL domain-containing protein [Solirubrobacterales bacterium]
MTVAVETREKSAAGAGALNARIQTAVLDSLKRIGIAEAVAQAAGGRIAGVIEIVVNPGNQAPEPPMVAMTMARGMEADAPTPVEAGTSKITVSVEARFRFEGKAGG